MSSWSSMTPPRPMGSPTPLTYLPQPCIPPTPLYRYDATSPDGQTELPVHRDNGLLTFSLTLGLTLTLTLGPSLTLSLPLTLALTLTLTLTRSAHLLPPTQPTHRFRGRRHLL